MCHVVGKPAPSNLCLKQLGQCASSPGHRDYCYAELAVFFSSGGHIYCTYPLRDGQAELTWVTGYVLK